MGQETAAVVLFVGTMTRTKRTQVFIFTINLVSLQKQKLRSRPFSLTFNFIKPTFA